jgi:hypothetical protein
MNIIVSDLALARRLERAEALANCAFVEARARLDPSLEACWIEVAGVRAMYDGPESPCTQTFGLGLFDDVAPADLDRLEAFFRSRSAPVHHEVSPLADKALWPVLSQRGYTPFEFTTVLVRQLSQFTQCATGEVQVSIAEPAEFDLVAQTAAEGWGVPAAMMRTFSESTTTVSFLGRLAESAVATAALNISGDIALLAGASTIPGARNRGAQRSLLQARLAYAASVGCEFAMICTEPGSSSQRNAQRQGFQIVYTRLKWRLPL